MTERTDPEWVRGAKSSVPQVLDDLWVNVFSWSAALAKRYQQDEHCAQDVAEDAYGRIRRNLDSYAFRCPFLGWCRTIVVNEMKRWLDKNGRAEKRNVDIDLTESESVSAVRIMLPEPAARVSDAGLRNRLQPCLDDLKGQEREVIELRYLQELMPQEVAERLGLQRNHVNVLAHRARQSLLDCLQRQGFASIEDVLSL